MHGVKLYFRWLSLPTLFAILAATQLVVNPKENHQKAAFLEAVFTDDAKLKRTLDRSMNTPDTISPDSGERPSMVRFELTVPDRKWWRPYKSSAYRKKKISIDFLLKVNDAFVIPGELSVRGMSSITEAFRQERPTHLNYSFRLYKPMQFEKGVQLQRFYLMNMIFDPFYFEMQFSYHLLNKLGLFPCYTQFVSLRMNGKPEGLYLLIERPTDAILRGRQNVVAIYRRRGKASQFFEAKLRSPELEENSHLNRLANALAAQHGNELEKELDSVIDLDGYLTWLAVNSLLRNADIYDEIYYYVVKSAEYPDGRIEFVAWDYDDIMADDAAHPELAIDDPLLFACQTELDRIIQRESVLYERFRNIFRELISQLSPELLHDILAEVEASVDGMEFELDEKDPAAFKLRRKGEIQKFETKLLRRRTELVDLLESPGKKQQTHPNR